MLPAEEAPTPAAGCADQSPAASPSPLPLGMTTSPHVDILQGMPRSNIRSPNKGIIAFAGPNGYRSKHLMIRVAVALTKHIHIQPSSIAIIFIVIVVSVVHVYDIPAVLGKWKNTRV